MKYSGGLLYIDRAKDFQQARSKIIVKKFPAFLLELLYERLTRFLHVLLLATLRILTSNFLVMCKNCVFKWCLRQVVQSYDIAYTSTRCKEREGAVK